MAYDEIEKSCEVLRCFSRSFPSLYQIVYFAGSESTVRHATYINVSSLMRQHFDKKAVEIHLQRRNLRHRRG